MQHANDNTPVATATGGLRFLSVCSGIEAASVAWHPLGWEAVAFSEIEKFPSAVLAHHYPDVPNLGDFTKIDTTTLGRVDILCGGTPCQAFSVAGLRQSLDDARGNLSLEFVRLAHELADGNGLRNVVWENVVGVLSTKDNAFGCFIGAMVGADDACIPVEPKPADGKSSKWWKWRAKDKVHAVKWPRYGMVVGPKGRASWAVKDAQYFGLAQRRERVLVVADFGNGADPVKVLFERKSLSGYSPASRETRKDVTGATAGGARGRRWPADLAPTLNAAFGDKQGLEDQHALNGAGLFVPHAVGVTGETSHSLTAEGADASEDGAGRGTPVVSYRVAGSGEVYEEGNRTAPLTTGTDPSANVIAFSAKDYGADATVELSPTLRAGGHTTSHANAGVMPAVAFHENQRAEISLNDTAGALGVGGGKPGQGYPAALVQSAVRRLTPVECERLQGFPDNYTRIPWRNKPADQCPDGPRYKALGNSWAVPKFTWLGRRLQAALARMDTTPSATQEAA